MTVPLNTFRLPPVFGLRIISLPELSAQLMGLVVFEGPGDENAIGFAAFDDTNNVDSSTAAEEITDPLVQSYLAEEK